MSKNPREGERLLLDRLLYENLRREVLRRDGWRCQSCGEMSNLEVHYKIFRSHMRIDTEANLITLCMVCHPRVHNAGPKLTY